MAHTPDDLVDSTETRLIEAAHDVFLEALELPIGFGDVSTRAGVSRSLVYSHFRSGVDLVNGVLEWQVAQFRQSGILDIVDQSDFVEAALTGLDHYFEHLKAFGPILHIASQDSFMEGKLSQRYTRMRDYILRRMGRRARLELHVSSNVGLALIILLAGLAEDAARLIRSGAVAEDTAKAVLQRSARRMIIGLTPRTILEERQASKNA